MASTPAPRPAPRLSAFTDEAALTLSGQLRLARSADVQSIDLRRVDGRAITSLDERRSAELARRLSGNGIQVPCVAAGVGKVPLTTPLGAVADELRRAATVAHAVGAPAVRVFSFLVDPRVGPPERRAVLGRLGDLLELAARLDVQLWLENEKGTYATTGARISDVLSELGGEGLGLILDPANLVQCGERPTMVYEAVRSHVRHVHAKDALASSGRVCRVGEGDAEWPAMRDALISDGYAGVLAVEPHLGLGGRGGPTSPRRWRGAVGALRGLWAAAGPALALQ